ncbi:MAG: hypothetical protein FJ088_11000, partial [Deltaproteobacteria bacterium]|nr:hypothetical protein [Deltaproteobacteria bacterium]
GNFVQFCNVVNGRRNAPKIISGNVNSGIFKGVGRIDDLFDYFPELHRREVTGAIGHVRYPTNTPDGCLTAQPHWGITYDGREIITSYSSQNGEITNNHSLRSFLGGERFFPVIGLKKTRTLGSDGFNSMLTESDGELIPNLVNYLLAKGYSQKEVADVLSGHREPETGRGMLGISGPVAAACSSNLGVIAFRDPRRLRPLIGAVAQDANGAYLIIASEESAIRYGCGKNGFDVLKIWEVRDNVFAGRDGCFLDLPEENETMFAERIVAERIPLLPVGGESLRRDPRGQESAPTDGFLPHPNSVTLDLAELRKDIEALSDEELFDLARFEGDNGKFLEDRQTYANRYVIRKIREEILNAVSQLRDAGAMKEKTELSVNLKNLLGERHLIAGTIGFLARKLSCDLPLAMAYRTEGTAGDNFAAFTSWRTRVFHRGNCGENLGNTACGSSIAVDGDARGALGYACFGSTKIFISGSAGVRAGAYMKGTSKENPAIIIGGTAGKWCGECAHHGKLIVLNLGGSRDFIGSGAGAGMEGSARVFVRAPLSAVTGKVGTGVRARGISGAER